MISIPDRSNFNPAETRESRNSYIPGSFPHTPTPALGHLQTSELGLSSPFQITLKVLNPSPKKALFWFYGAPPEAVVTPIGIYVWADGPNTDPPSGTLFDPPFVMQDTRAYRFVVTFGATTTIEVYEEGRTPLLSSMTSNVDTSGCDLYLGYRSDDYYINTDLQLPDGVTIISITGA